MNVQIVLEWLKNQIYLLNCDEENRVISGWDFNHKLSGKQSSVFY